jgi:dTDP-4-amino-4,6-dideoxygalactose transaminase
MVEFLGIKKITAKYADELHDAVNRVFDSGCYIQGEENKKFEADYAKYIGTTYCVGCANGLDALNWILRAYIELGRISKGDEVIVPANTFIATILSITDNGLKPILIEPREDNLEIDDEKIEKAITQKTKAIMIVHLYGRCAYTEKIGQICKQYDLYLFEDNAQSHGCAFNGKRTGSLGDAGAHSFYPGKNLGAFGDAGAVTTNDEEVATAIRSLANYGSTRKYVFKYVGRNSRLDEIQAAVLDVKLHHIDEDNAYRQKIAAYYYEHISNPLITLPVQLPDENNVYHLFPVFCSYRDILQEYLSKNGIGTIIHYPIPPHKQECYAREKWNTPQLSLPITEKIANEELSLPISPVQTREETEEVVNILNSFRL